MPENVSQMSKRASAIDIYTEVEIVPRIGSHFNFLGKLHKVPLLHGIICLRMIIGMEFIGEKM